MKRYFAPALIVLFLVCPYLSADDSFTFNLDNHLQIIQLKGGDSAIASLTLVCPLPENLSARDRAAFALMNEIIWLNTNEETPDGAAAYTEFIQAAQRFEGTLSSELTPDALIIQMSLPKALLPFMLKRYVGMWSEINITAEELAAAKRRVIAKQQATTLNSIESQLANRIAPHLWEGTYYGLENHGAESVVNATTISQLRNAFKTLKNPANWTLFIRGIAISEEQRTVLNQTVGNLASSSELKSKQTSPMEDRVATAKKVLVESESDKSYATVAFRLPAGEIQNLLLVDVTKEMLRIGDRLPEMKETLASSGKPAMISVNSDMRKNSGMIYMIATWSGHEVGANSAINLFLGVSSGFINDEMSQSDFEAAKRRLTLNYWIRYANIDNYVLWRARLASMSIYEDNYLLQLNSLSFENLRTFVNTYYVRENSISLITVAP